MVTQAEGTVWAFESRRGWVAVQVGLTPKVIRIPTDETWSQGQKVLVTVTPANEAGLPDGAVIIPVEGWLD